MAALYMIGKYDESLAVARVAERWFQANSYVSGLAKIAANLGNLFDRREQHTTALQHHYRARDLFERFQDWPSLAMTYLNLGNCLSFTNQLAEADEMYSLAQSLSQKLGMKELLMQVMYNRSYLMFLRGQSTEALRAFTAVKEYFAKTGSELHVLLCDLDISEIFLHVGRPAESIALARDVSEGFAKLSMPYEHAKALTFCAIGLVRLDKIDEAEETANLARSVFQHEGNRYWISVLDFCLAYLRLARGDFARASQLAAQAKVEFEELELRSSMADSLAALGSLALGLNPSKQSDSGMNEVLKLTKNRRR
jgi:tetratricopeptide (TPR) repeat protein